MREREKETDSNSTYSMLSFNAIKQRTTNNKNITINKTIKSKKKVFYGRNLDLIPLSSMQVIAPCPKLLNSETCSS